MRFLYYGEACPMTHSRWNSAPIFNTDSTWFREVVKRGEGMRFHADQNPYVSKFEWFWYDYGMMVWMWYDCMIVVWWFGSCVCECECIQIEEIAKKCKTKNRLKEPQKISRKTSSVVILFAFVYPCVSPEDPEEQKCYFLYYYIKEIYNIKKSSGSSGTSRTYTQLNQNTDEDFLEKVFKFYTSVFRAFRNTSSK